MDGGSRDIKVGIHFSDFFGLDPKAIESYGAFNVSLVNDVPLFIDPFLLFDSKDAKYMELHEGIISYLRFLRDESRSNLPKANLDQWFFFREVKQNWLGFSKKGNSGNGLGRKFAGDLHRNLHHIFSNFGEESITKGSHLEKVCLFSDGVGRDHLSDFTTNLIKEYLLEYTQTFAMQYLQENQRRNVTVSKVRFDYKNKRWMSGRFVLPFVMGDHVILTPRDILTRDEAWINRKDMIDGLEDICEAVPDNQLRAQINHYFASRLSDDATEKEVRRAAADTLAKFPVLVDHYIRSKEDRANEAHKQSGKKVAETQEIFVDQVREFVQDYLVGTDFYKKGGSFEESLARVEYLKSVIEDKDGWRLFYVKGSPITQEAHLQILYRFTWYAAVLDVNREPNNGRGPVDYAVSYGSKDKTLVEFKLARNSKLKSNLENQVATYEKANDTRKSITVIMHFNDSEYLRVRAILAKLKFPEDKKVVLVDASPKTSASNIT